ncbi:MAG: hypothetical protein MK364_16470 [Pirellulales bacterium]|nr:hypothetical protein [Pirellulales bacterium]
MPQLTDIRLMEVRSEYEQIDYRSPIKFGGRVVNDVVLFNVQVDVETGSGKRATGFGSMPVGNVWAWPSLVVDTPQTLDAMIQMGNRMVDNANTFRGTGHPLEITQELSQSYPAISTSVAESLKLAEAAPELACLVAASPLEAAIHDAYGRALEKNSYDVLGQEFVNQDLGAFLSADFSGEYLDRYTSRTPKTTMPLYHLVGALDPLTDTDLDTPLEDGLPETLGDWILADGLTHLKIKLSGDNLNWDVDRVVRVEAAAAPAQQRRGCQEWHYSLDFNEKCENVQYVLDFLAHLAEQCPAALTRVQYIEQPTHRDLRANPENRMHEAARVKPVVIDESLVDYESLLLAREQGYSGVALKACKGHTEALLMGAAAQKHNLFLCVQDLTCVGSSFLHSASIAARLPTIAAIEGNGRQYCPRGNEGWSQRYRGMFEVSDGTVATSELTELGLGFSPP